MNFRRLLYLIILICTTAAASAQVIERDTAFQVDYSRTARTYVIANITVSGVENYDDNMLIGLSGLAVGQRVHIPGDEFTKAIRRYWKHGLFSDASIRVDSIVRDSAYLHIGLSRFPVVSEINYRGIKKGDRDELEKRIVLKKEVPATPSTIAKSRTYAKKYFDEKGFKNAEIVFNTRDDVSHPGKVIVDIDIDKKEKVKINEIIVEGNTVLPIGKIKGSLLSKGALKSIHQRGHVSGWFRSKKFVDAKYKEAKDNLIEKYGELGYRDAMIVEDSVYAFDDKSVNVYLRVDEGQRYYIRNIEWVGNTVYPTDILQDRYLKMYKGDVYNRKLMDDRLKNDDGAVGNLYYNNGYVFYQLDQVETNVVGDSVDLELRIFEGPQAHISHVKIVGNDRVYENVVRRELRNKPGDLFSREALERSYREIASMGHFEPDAIKPDVQPDPDNGTVDLTWDLTPKSNDQIEFSLGYGQTGVIGKIGLKFSNFCLANLFNKEGLRRGVMPQGNGETFSISGQTNGRYYQAYSVNYMNPWFGGKRPTALTLSAFFSKSTDVSDQYYNSAYYNNFYNSYLYGIGNSGYNYYENYYDPDKYIKVVGASLGLGKRLRWPDDYFQVSADLSYTRYMLKDWQYFTLMSTGSCNNISLNLSLSRASTDNQIYPRRGSEFLLLASITPPYSMMDNKNYAGLANNYQSPSYQREMQEKYRWVEYHKWKFKSRTFTPLTRGDKCLVLMTRVELGILGHYNKHKLSPFETFYVGGDGTSGYSGNYATETIGLRGYDNGALGTNYAYDRFTMEIRYPLMLGNSTNIFALAFVEGGNAWRDIKKFNPLDMKRSAGIGARIFLPMVGLLGIDWAYGFDPINGSRTYGGSQFHFILGQEF